MRSHMLMHPLPSPESAASSSLADLGFVLQDRESETESPTRKRFRLNRRSIYVSLRHQQSKEDAAEEIKIGVQELSESCTEHEPMSSVSDAATEEEDVALSLMLLSRDKWESDERWKKKSKWFECETCEKVFKSYQALGGHRASHKKKSAESNELKKSSSSNHHECPICSKVFSSGQALGDHKRSHATKRGLKIRLIDLNLPAPWEEEEDLVSSVF